MYRLLQIVHKGLKLFLSMDYIKLHENGDAHDKMPYMYPLYTKIYILYLNATIVRRTLSGKFLLGCQAVVNMLLHSVCTLRTDTQ